MKTAEDFYKEHPDYKQKDYKNKPVVGLSNWSIGPSFGGGYKVADGEVYNHPNFVDGQSVTTSVIVRHEGNIVETLNTIYVLIGEAYTCPPIPKVEEV